MSLATDNHAFVFDLNGDNEGGFYRVDMTNKPGERNRHVMINRGEKFQVNANLLDVIHGTTEPGGLEATLLIADFSFLPSNDKRFVEVTITWAFSSEDPNVEISVAKVAPYRSWSLCPMKQAQEANLTGRASVGTGSGPVTANAGAEYSMKKAWDRDFHTVVEGSQRMENRSKGGYDAVRWHLAENPKAKTGVCRTLRVAVLLHRVAHPGHNAHSGLASKFRGDLSVVADKGGWSEAAALAKKVWKKAPKDEAVVFQPGFGLESGRFEIDRNNLGGAELEQDIMFMGLHESFDDLRKDRAERRKKLEEQKLEKQKLEEQKLEEQKLEEQKLQEQESQEMKLEQHVSSMTGSSVERDGARQFPSWVFFVIFGIFLAYAWQQLVKTF